MLWEADLYTWFQRVSCSLAFYWTWPMGGTCRSQGKSRVRLGYLFPQISFYWFALDLWKVTAPANWPSLNSGNCSLSLPFRSNNGNGSLVLLYLGCSTTSCDFPTPSSHLSIVSFKTLLKSTQIHCAYPFLARILTATTSSSFASDQICI